VSFAQSNGSRSLMHGVIVVQPSCYRIYRVNYSTRTVAA
jgi:hypothetical protein